MKSLLPPRKTRLLIPACGLLALLLRRLMAAGTDDRGLLRPGHPAWIALLILSAAVAAVILLGIRNVRGSGRYRVSFPPSLPAAAGNLLTAVSAAVAAAAFWNGIADVSHMFNPAIAAARIPGGIVQTLAPLVFLLIALCRLRGRKPVFGLHVLACIHFALQALALYQNCSFDPQLQNYCFQLFACIALTLTAYHLAQFDIGSGSHRRLWLWGQISMYLCCACLDSGLLYLSGAVWAFTSLSRLRRRRPRRQPEPAPVTTEEVYYPD